MEVRLKILMCGNHCLNKGGMTTVINHITAYDWRKRNIELRFVPIYYPSIKIVMIFYYLISVVKVIYLMNKWKPDILHLHMSYRGSFYRNYGLYKVAKKYDIPVVIHLHGSEFETWYNQCNKIQKKRIIELISNIECLIVLGEKWERFIKRICPKAKTIIINNAVVIPQEKVSWNNEQINLLFMGVLIPRKGVDVLLQVLKDVSISHKLRLIVAGSGEEEQKLKEMAQSFNIHVSFLGWLNPENIKYQILKSQIMVLPSYNEGLPMAILEAMSYGMPVIASNVGDISTAVIDGINGLLVPPGDKEALSRSIVSVCNKEVFEKMSDESKRICIERFSLDTFYKRLEVCYRTVIT